MVMPTVAVDVTLGKRSGMDSEIWMSGASIVRMEITESIAFSLVEEVTLRVSSVPEESKEACPLLFPWWKILVIRLARIFP